MSVFVNYIYLNLCYRKRNSQTWGRSYGVVQVGISFRVCENHFMFSLGDNFIDQKS